MRVYVVYSICGECATIHKAFVVEWDAYDYVNKNNQGDGVDMYYYEEVEVE